MSDTQHNTEILDLPSKGWFYPAENPLSSGTIEIRYMGAREEDILTSTGLVKKGVAIDMVLKNVLVSQVNYDDLLIGDKNALMIATRVLGYGKNYDVEVTCPVCEAKQKITIDLAKLEHKEVNVEQWPQGVNEFSFTLPISNHKVTFRFLCSKDETEVSSELTAIKKIQTEYTPDLSTRMKKMITSVDGDRTLGRINKLVDSEIIAGDSLALRRYVNSIQPGIDMNFSFKCSNKECAFEDTLGVPLTVEFFWPSGK